MIGKHIYSFKNALNGLNWLITTQPNFRLHLLLSILAVLLGIVLKVAYSEFLLIFLLIGIGLAIETVNTAIEEAIDAIHKNWSEEIKIAKDVSAGAMLIFSITALVIACFIFIPRILERLTIKY